MITSNRKALPAGRQATHPLQTLEWGQFREKTGVKVVRGYNFQITVHEVPFLNWRLGYLPKGPMPSKRLVDELRKIGKDDNLIFIQLEPNVKKTQIENRKSKNNWKLEIGNWKLRKAAHPLFTKFTFVLDLTKSEEELLKNMHSKTRYNIRVAQKHGVKVVEDNSDKAFNEYLKLTFQTTQRQKFYAHDKSYHQKMWEALKNQKSKTRFAARRVKNQNSDRLSAHLLLAKYKPRTTNSEPITLAAWLLFVFKDTLYYPYGASSDENREVMASNLMMWEAIKFGKKLGLKKFDMWGSLGPDPDKNDPWYGFHRFKEGYGAELVEFVGSYDLVIDPLKYEIFKILDTFRTFLLKLLSQFA